MDFKEFLITPIWLMIVYLLAYVIRPQVTDSINRRYFMPALTVKIIGAICVGLIYQFYYKGGDTFTYFNLGSRYIWEAFLNEPLKALGLILHSGKGFGEELYPYSTRIYTFGDPASYFVVRVAGIFDILTGHTYYATSVLFAAASFTGVWAFYLVVYRRYPHLHFWLAVAVFFVPSLFFWGSGILKDSITLGALGWSLFLSDQIFFMKRNVLFNLLLLSFFLWIISVVKVYILLCFMPALVFWLLVGQVKKVSNPILRAGTAPILLAVSLALGYFSIVKIGETSNRYNLEVMAETARVTAEWNHYVSIREGGSAYTLGDFDYTPSGIVRKIPAAIWVTLFRPYIWETRNIVMMLSSLESASLLLLFIYTLFQSGPIRFFKAVSGDPMLLAFLIFSLVFAFAVGLSSYNFGSLVRYKIPMLPFFVSLLFIVRDQALRDMRMSRR